MDSPCDKFVPHLFLESDRCRECGFSEKEHQIHPSDQSDSEDDPENRVAVNCTHFSPHHWIYDRCRDCGRSESVHATSSGQNPNIPVPPSHPHAEIGRMKVNADALRARTGHDLASANRLTLSQSPSDLSSPPPNRIVNRLGLRGSSRESTPPDQHLAQLHRSTPPPMSQLQPLQNAHPSHLTHQGHVSHQSHMMGDVEAARTAEKEALLARIHQLDIDNDRHARDSDSFRLQQLQSTEQLLQKHVLPDGKGEIIEGPASPTSQVAVLVADTMNKSEQKLRGKVEHAENLIDEALQKARKAEQDFAEARERALGESEQARRLLLKSQRAMEEAQRRVDDAQRLTAMEIEKAKLAAKKEIETAKEEQRRAIEEARLNAVKELQEDRVRQKAQEESRLSALQKAKEEELKRETMQRARSEAQRELERIKNEQKERALWEAQRRLEQEEDERTRGEESAREQARLDAERERIRQQSLEIEAKKRALEDARLEARQKALEELNRLEMQQRAIEEDRLKQEQERARQLALENARLSLEKERLKQSALEEARIQLERERAERRESERMALEKVRQAAMEESEREKARLRDEEARLQVERERIKRLAEEEAERHKQTLLQKQKEIEDVTLRALAEAKKEAEKERERTEQARQAAIEEAKREASRLKEQAEELKRAAEADRERAEAARLESERLREQARLQARRDEKDRLSNEQARAEIESRRQQERLDQDRLVLRQRMLELAHQREVTSSKPFDVRLEAARERVRKRQEDEKNRTKRDSLDSVASYPPTSPYPPLPPQYPPQVMMPPIPVQPIQLVPVTQPPVVQPHIIPAAVVDLPAEVDLIVNVTCKNLVQMDWMTMCDPVVGVYQHLVTGELKLLGTTEWIQDTLNPVFKKRIHITHQRGLKPVYSFRLFDSEDGSLTDTSLVGTCVVSLDDAMLAPGQPYEVALAFVNKEEPQVNKALQRANATLSLSVTNMTFPPSPKPVTPVPQPQPTYSLPQSPFTPVQQVGYGQLPVEHDQQHLHSPALSGFPQHPGVGYPDPRLSALTHSVPGSANRFADFIATSSPPQHGSASARVSGVGSGDMFSTPQGNHRPHVSSTPIVSNDEARKVELAVQCRDLPTFGRFINSIPVASLFLKDSATGKLTYLGQTEKNRSERRNPAFQKRFVVDYYPNRDQEFKVSVYDTNTDQLQEKNRIGSAFVFVNEIVSSPGQDFTYRLENDTLNMGRNSGVVLTCTRVLAHESMDGLNTSASSSSSSSSSVAANAAEARAVGRDSLASLSPSPNISLNGKSLPASPIPPTEELLLSGDAPDRFPAIVHKIQAMMATGRTFPIYYDDGNPAKLSVFYRRSPETEPFGALHWCEEGKRVVDFTRCLPLGEVSDIFTGKQTYGLQRPEAYDAPAPHCFSLVSPRLTLNLEAKSRKQRDSWVFGIMGILRPSKQNVKLHRASSAEQDDIPGKIEDMMSKGSVFVRHAVGSAPAANLVVFRSDEGSAGAFAWGPSHLRPSTFTNTIPISDLTDVYVGKQTKAFAAPSAAEVDEEICFSLVTSTNSLDLEANSARQRAAWVLGIMRILRRSSLSATLHQLKDKDGLLGSSPDRPVAPSSSRESLVSNRDSLPQGDVDDMKVDPSATNGTGPDGALSDIVKKLEKMMRYGRVFAKYSLNGTAVRRSVFYKPSGAYPSHALYWCKGSARIESAGHCLPFTEIVGIVIGKQTATFQRSAKSVEDSKCFSILGKSRSLHLEAKHANQRDAWVFGTVALMKAYGAKPVLYQPGQYSPTAAGAVPERDDSDTDEGDPSSTISDEETARSASNSLSQPTRSSGSVQKEPRRSSGQTRDAEEKSPKDAPAHSRAPSYSAPSKADSQQTPPKSAIGGNTSASGGERSARGSGSRHNSRPASRLGNESENEPEPPKAVEIYIRCRNLPAKVDASDTSNHQVCLFQRDGTNRKWKYLEQSEQIQGSKDPVFGEKFAIDYAPGTSQYLRFNVYDVRVDSENLEEKDRLGAVEVPMDQLAEAVVRQHPRSFTLNVIHDDPDLNTRLSTAGAVLIIEFHRSMAVGESEPDADDFRTVLGRSTPFTAYLSNYPHSVAVSLRDSSIRISSKSGSFPSSIALSSISDVVLGKRGGSFPVDASADCCVSLGSTHARLDLEAQNSKSRTDWVSALHGLLRSLNVAVNQ